MHTIPSEKHPKGLYILFFIEMWERFSYYGMKAILVLYLISETQKGGLGWSNADASNLYKWYTSLFYFTPLFMGYVADRYLGHRKSMLIGAAMIALGHITLSVDTMPLFYTGLGLLVIGNGFFKPVVSSMVGQLYSETSKLKDAAYNIFYMGINIGAILGVFICGYLGERIGWHYGFGAAAIGMGIGLTQYILFKRHLGDVGLKPIVSASSTEPSAPLTKVERDRILMVFIVSFFSITFFLASEQAGSSLNIFAYNYTDRYTTNRLQIDEYVAGNTQTDSLALDKVQGILNSREAQYLKTAEIDSTINAAIFTADNATIHVADYIRKSSFSIAKDSMDNRLLKAVKFAPAVWMDNDQFKVSKLAETKVVLLQPSTWFQEIPASWLQNLNPLIIILLSPLFAMCWLGLGRRGREPGLPAKIGIGLSLLGIGFLVMAYGARTIPKGAEVSDVSMIWILAAISLHTFGEISLYPNSLAAINKLSPKRMLGMMMSVFLFAAAVANYIGGAISGLMDKVSQTQTMSGFFMLFVYSSFAAALLAFLLSRWMKKKMHDAA